MPKYYVNNTPQAMKCIKRDVIILPLILDKKNLGYHDNCESAVKRAEEDYHQVNGCYYCSNECHTT